MLKIKKEKSLLAPGLSNQTKPNPGSWLYLDPRLQCVEPWLGDGRRRDGLCKVDMAAVCRVDQGLERTLCLTISGEFVSKSLLPSPMRGLTRLMYQERGIWFSQCPSFHKMDFWRLHRGWETLTFWGVGSEPYSMQVDVEFPQLCLDWGFQ